MEKYFFLWLLFILFAPSSSKAFSDWMMRRRQLNLVKHIVGPWIPEGEKVRSATVGVKDGFCLVTVGRHLYDLDFRFQVWTWQGIARDADSYTDLNPWEVRRDAREALRGTPVERFGPMFVRKDGLAEIVTDDGLYELNLQAKTARKLKEEPRLA